MLGLDRKASFGSGQHVSGRTLMILKNVKAIFSEFDAYCGGLDRNGCISYPVTISRNMTGSDYGKPVVIILGEPWLADDLPPGELQVPFEVLEEVRQVGYGAQPLSAEEIKDYWREARRLKVKDHWHPEARLVQY
jgi:hypothetical protein